MRPRSSQTVRRQDTRPHRSGGSRGVGRRASTGAGKSQARPACSTRVVPTRRPEPPRLHHAFGRACRGIRLRLDLSLRELAGAADVSVSYLARIERGVADPTLGVAARIASALGADLSMELRPPVFLTEHARGDRLHAWCVGYVTRRLRALGWDVTVEVPLVDGRYRGWIDVLAFDPDSGCLLAIEVKTWLDDVGACLRQVEWYGRHARRVAIDRGWRPRIVGGALLVLATAENDRLIHAHDDLLRPAFPVRGSLPAQAGAHGLALIDPARRRGSWLLRPTVDGRRTAAPYLDLADAARRRTQMP